MTVDDPWGWGRSLEWATSCPPPRHNFASLPRIRSESPAFDLHHPEIVALEGEHHNTNLLESMGGVAEQDGRAELADPDAQPGPDGLPRKDA